MKKTLAILFCAAFLFGCSGGDGTTISATGTIEATEITLSAQSGGQVKRSIQILGGFFEIFLAPMQHAQGQKKICPCGSRFTILGEIGQQGNPQGDFGIQVFGHIGEISIALPGRLLGL